MYPWNDGILYNATTLPVKLPARQSVWVVPGIRSRWENSKGESVSSELSYQFAKLGYLGSLQHHSNKSNTIIQSDTVQQSGSISLWATEPHQEASSTLLPLHDAFKCFSCIRDFWPKGRFHPEGPDGVREGGKWKKCKNEISKGCINDSL